MNARTSRTRPGRPRPSRPRRRREVVTSVAVVVGAGAVLAFDAAAAGLAGADVDDPPAPATDDVAAPEVRGTAGLGGPLVSAALPVVRRPAAVPPAQRAAERAEARRSAAEAAERQAAEEAAAAERAEAERAAVWDRLADCESGRWDRERRPIAGSARWDYGLDPSEDGFFQGGLQFHPVTWDEFRDAGMPEHAGEASRAVQIAVAERVLEVQGWRAWPVCSRKLGYR